MVAQERVVVPLRSRVAVVVMVLVATCLYQAAVCALLQAQVAHPGARWSSQQALALAQAVVM